MSSATLSDESTLNSPPPSDDRPPSWDEYNRDVFISLDKLSSNIRRCKALLAPALAVSLGLEIVNVVGKETLTPARGWAKYENWFLIGEQWSNIAGLVIVGICIAFYVLALIYPVRRPTEPGGSLRNKNLHYALCVFLFLSSGLCLILHPLPSILYTILTHRAPPSFNLGYPQIRTGRNVALALVFLISGCMRRGPKRRFTPLRLGTGFGVNSDEPEKPPGGRAITGPNLDGDNDVEVQSTLEAKNTSCNVLDYAGSSMLDFILLSYMAPLARRSLKVPKLLQSDLPHLEDYIRRSGAGQSLSASGEGSIAIDENGKQKKGMVTNWMLIKAVWKGRGYVVFSNLALETINTCLSYLQVLSMHEIIKATDNPQDYDKAYAYLMCWGLFAGQTVECILSAYAWVRENYLCHMPVRMSLSSMLFTKILRTTDAQGMEAHNVTEEENNAGKGRAQIMNLLTIDAGTIAGLATNIWNITNAIIALVVGIYFMYQMFGISAIIGVACIPLSTPLSFWVSQHSFRADRSWARARDARTSAIKEFLLSYKVIKLNAFEPHFRRRIERLRKIEIKWQRWRFTLGTMFNILADQLPALAIFVTFFFHTKVFGNELNPATAFVALSVFNRVKASLQFVPYCMQMVFETLVALNRLVTFLNQPEIDLADWVTTSNIIAFKDATLGWPAAAEKDAIDQKAFKLRGVDMTLPEGKFTLVCGPLGSGKTLLLRALLGEATIEEGTLMAPRSGIDETPLNGYAIQGPWTKSRWLDDSICYAPQQAYIRHGTIRDNILFGQPMWRSRYKEALRQASLLSDLTLMSDGDLTEVGDHGVNLSGGQKARINLARCIYSRAKTVYMDDILSAVDAHTAQFIFKECLQGSLLRGRTVVLVTHHVGLCLPGADFLVSLNHGRVEQACDANLAKVDDLEIPESPIDEKIDLPNVKQHFEDEESEDPTTTARKLYQEEQSSAGRVATGHYVLVFAAAGGIIYWLLLAFLYGSTTGFDIWRSVFLRQWTEDADPSHLDANLYWYFFIVTAGVVIGAIRWIWLYGVGPVGFYNSGSMKIHAELLDRICGAPLSFFESTPAGRIMNIFGQDMRRIDANVADDFGRTVMALLSVGTSALFVCFEAPLLLTILVVFAIPLYWLSDSLGKLRADIRRLTAVAGSPLITLYNDAIQGIVMIRAYGSSELMMAAMQSLINRERQAFSADWQVYNWVKSMIRAISSVFVTATGFWLVSKDLSGAEVGLILSFAVAASQGLFNLLETYSNLEQTFVSAERINHYIQMDAHESTEGDIPQMNWPQRGSIKFKEMSIRYAADLPEVLHRVSFDIEPGMRVGVVGATGSGKSTLALTLFRAIEPHEGCIEIDGVDIKTIEMHQLRTRLNMVVQDGSLASGTLRDALDITGEKDDHEIYEALRRVHLLDESVGAEELKDNPFANLDSFVALEGANFSHGQRQLLCLARALLKHSRVLVMDEATSGVDFEMDAKITATIKECFAGTTMLVIAHRLATIIHYDRVLVLDQGRVKEYGVPLDLAKDTNSAFHGLCMAQGQEEYEKLMSMASL